MANDHTFSIGFLESQIRADLNGNEIVESGAVPTFTYSPGDNYVVDGTLASVAALNSVKAELTTWHSKNQSTAWDSKESSYLFTNLRDSASNLSGASSADLGNVTGELTVTDDGNKPAQLGVLQSIKSSFSGSTFTYYGVQGSTKDLADSRGGSYDWIDNITPSGSPSVKHATITNLSTSEANTKALVQGFSSDEILFTVSGLTANSNPFIATPTGDNATLAYQSGSIEDSTTTYTNGTSSFTLGKYTVTALGFAKTDTPTEGNLDHFNVTDRDVSNPVELTFNFYGGEQLSHVNISGADLSTSAGYSYTQTAGDGTSKVTDDVWTLKLKIEAGQPAKTSSVADNTGKEVLGVMVNSVSANDVGGTDDYGGSVFRTNAWWNDIGLMSEEYKFSDLSPGFAIDGTDGEQVDFDFYFTKDYLERTFSVEFDAIDGGFTGSGLSSVDASNDHSGTYIDVSKTNAISALRLPVDIKDVTATTAGGETDFYQVEFTNNSWSQANVSLVYGPSVNAAPTPSPSPQPTPTPAPEPTPDPTPADTAPLATDVQLSDDDGDGLKEVITAADGALIDGNGDGIADAEQSDVVGLRMINDGAENTDYGALETDPALSFSAVSFLSPTELAANNSETYAVTTSDGQTQTTAIPTGIDNAFDGLLGFTVSGLSNGGSTSTTISLPQGLNTLDTTQLAYLRFNYATNRFEDFVDNNGIPLYAFQDSNGDGQLDSVVLQLIDGDPAWDGDGIANGSIIDPGFLATGDRKLSGNNKDNTLQGNVLANTLLGKGGSDTLIGDLGNDILIGHGKHDRLRGGEGNDNLKGKTGDDRLHGGDHDDHLDGGKGDDILIGGSGADHFRLSKGSDTIKDFSIADDDQLLISNATNLKIEQVGSNLLITDSKNMINTKLLNTPMSELLNHQPDLLA